MVELVVATVMISVIMLGTISATYALKNFGNSTSSDAFLAMETAAMVLQIEQTALKAIGDITDPGLVITDNFATTQGKSLCIRTEIVDPPTPGNYTDDQWVCYWQSNAQPEIYRCLRTAAQGSGLCTGTASDTEIGNSLPRGYDVGDPTLSGFTFSFTPQQIYLDLSIATRLDPTKIKSRDNPEYTIQTRIYPQGQGGA